MYLNLHNSITGVKNLILSENYGVYVYKHCQIIMQMLVKSCAEKEKRMGNVMYFHFFILMWVFCHITSRYITSCQEKICSSNVFFFPCERVHFNLFNMRRGNKQKITQLFCFFWFYMNFSVQCAWILLLLL